MRPGILSRLRGDRSGAVAVVFALSLIPMLGFTGLATDYAKSVLVKRRLELAIDSATLAAVRRTIDLLNDGEHTTEEAKSEGESEGRAYLASQSHRIMDATLRATSVEVFVEGNEISSRAEYEASVPTVFARLFALDRFEVAGASRAAATISPYVDVHLLIDISQSMGIGATPEDQEKLRTMQVRRFNRSGSYTEQNGCAFACHILKGSFVSNTDSYPSLTSYQWGHLNNARTRIDVVRDAVEELATSLLTSDSRRIRVAIHTFHSAFDTPLPLSRDLGTITAAAGRIHLSSQQGGTNMHVALRRLNAAIETPGDGLTQANAKAVVVVMTDGTEGNQMEYPRVNEYFKDPNFVVFEPTRGDFGGMVQSLDPDICDPLKDRDIRMIAMNTKYLIPANQSNVKFDFIRETLHRYIESNMAECVSAPEDYYDASSPEDIARATQQIATSISKPLALTQ